eukprot:1126970-Amphidinium_carterae.1
MEAIQASLGTDYIVSAVLQYPLPPRASNTSYKQTFVGRQRATTSGRPRSSEQTDSKRMSPQSGRPSASVQERETAVRLEMVGSNFGSALHCLLAKRCLNRSSSAKGKLPRNEFVLSFLALPSQSGCTSTLSSYENSAQQN